MQRTCFVIMPIGDQAGEGPGRSQQDLRRRFDDLIREALIKADPTLDITRADDVALPGSITTDILTRIMHSDIVVADITFPNPNVFYELGLRHAARPGTVIIRDRTSPPAPFDVANLRHIAYDNTPSGLKELAAAMQQALAFSYRDPLRPDNHFLELAKLTQYVFPDYRVDREDSDPTVELFMALLTNAPLREALSRASEGQEMGQEEILRLFGENPEVARTLLSAMRKQGALTLGIEDAGVGSGPNRAARRQAARTVKK